MSDLIQILLARPNVDFHNYKENTVTRRINRRMAALETRITTTQVAQVEALNNDERQVYIRQMEVKVAQTRDTLQQTVEELQTTDEALQATDEELQATNEKLQSTNEELIARRASQTAMSQFNIGDLPAMGFHLSQWKLPQQMSSRALICNDVFTFRE